MFVPGVVAVGLMFVVRIVVVATTRSIDAPWSVSVGLVFVRPMSKKSLVAAWQAACLLLFELELS